MAVVLQTPLIIRDDDDLVRASAENPGYSFEREADGAIRVTPTSTGDGAKSGEAFFQIATYAKQYGGKAYDSNTGFAIGPGKTVRSPDASWLSPQKIASLDDEEKVGFWPICPDVVIEGRSSSDDFKETVAKTKAYIERGAIYAVAINPQTREIEEFGAPPAGLSLDFDAIIDA
jgi:Uma2 family endonuclease